jgi:hypothetical protein
MSQETKKEKSSDFYFKYMKYFNEFCKNEKSKFYSYNFDKGEPEDIPHDEKNFEWRHVNENLNDVKISHKENNKDFISIASIRERFNHEKLPDLIKEFESENFNYKSVNKLDG